MLFVKYDYASKCIDLNCDDTNKNNSEASTSSGKTKAIK